MTTTIMILAHSWPVLVTAIDHRPATDSSPAHIAESEVMTVQPGAHGNSYITSTRELRITEMPLPPTSAPETFYDRLHTERAELFDRWQKLNSFCATDDFAGLPVDAQEDLRAQSKIMSEYHAILARRMDSITPPKPAA